MKVGQVWRSAAMAVLAAVATTVCVGEDKTPAKDTIPLPDNKTVEFAMLKVPGGKITLKDENGKEKEYEIKPFWMGQYEVRWDEYDVFWEARDIPGMNKEKLKTLQDAHLRPSKPYEPPNRQWGREGWPAGSMFCVEAKNYCKWLSERTGKKYRLPTEAEWEYVCRAGGAPVRLKGKDLKEVAWFGDNSDEEPHHVGKKKPNVWGFYDMLGNVGEWVIRDDGTECIAGGTFRDDAEDVHSGARESYSPKWQAKDPQEPKGKSWLASGPFVGFRIVRED
jgi:formylglycine-generating enzyme required for sulfatase activity